MQEVPQEKAQKEARNQYSKSLCRYSMELDCYLKTHATEALVGWAPREVGQEADEFAKGDYHRLDPSRRSVVPVSFRWDILDERLRETARMRTEREHPACERINKGRRPENSLRVTDPW